MVLPILLGPYTIKTLFGTSSSIKILRTLSEIPAAFTIEELQKETGLSRGIVHKTINELNRNRFVVDIESKGKLMMFRLNVEHDYYTHIIDIFSFEKKIYRRNVVILNVWNVLESVVSSIINKKINVVSIWLFGSQARGTAAVTSDVDLFIITEQKNLEDEKIILSICDKYSKKLFARINMIIMTFEEYETEREKKTAFIEQIQRGSIELFRDSWQLLENMGKLAKRRSDEP